jgi:hypothetical protein
LALRHGLILAFDRTGWAFDAELLRSGDLLLRHSRSDEQRGSNQGAECRCRCHALKLSLETSRETSRLSKLSFSRSSSDNLSAAPPFRCTTGVARWII